jgi:SPP1 family predicted phage head-tail adaptor
MNAGELRHIIEIQAIGTTRGAAGEVVDTWTTETNGTVWASIEPMSGRELYNAKQINAEITHKVKLWYYQGLTPAKRILFGTRVFNILEVMNVEERNIEHLVYAKEMV